MARKTRKQKQRAAARRQTPVRSDAGGATPSPAGAATAGPTLELQTAAPDAAEPGGVAAPVGAMPTPLPGPAAAVPAAAPAGARRRVERLNAPAAAATTAPARVSSHAATMFAPLESDDAAIPFDRVPYVPADLRRVAVMAGLMVVLIIIAAVVVSHLVK